jgi:hypothetical protein
MLTYQRCFLSKVGAIAGNYDLPGNLALTVFSSQAINPTLTRAEMTLLQY